MSDESVMHEKSESRAKENDEILEEARERFAYVVDNDKDNRDNQRSDTQFVYVPGKQWPDAVRSKRKGWNEICLEFNQLKQFVNQVVNDQRQNRPSIQIHPAGGESSKETAEILQGLIRNIEYDSNAEAAYDTGFQNAVVGGRGWWRICTEYEKGSFNQKILIKPIPDSNTVYADTAYQEPDGCDRQFVFVTEVITRKDFERRYPKAEPTSWDDVDTHWKDGEDKLIIADYYRRISKERVLVQMSDGAIGWKDEMPKPPEGVTILAERNADSYSIEWYKIAGGNQVLEQFDCPGEYIPVICTTGDDILVDGQRMYQGLIRQARDSQSMLNFGMTQQATHLALTPKAPWVVAEGQIEGYEEIWKNANTNNYSVLPYKPTDINGTPVPPPQRTAPSMPDAGWINWCGSMLQMTKSTIGLYENSLGQRATEVSGKAIVAREKQGDTATFHYVDNQSRAIALTGRIILDWIPIYYDTERIVHIIGPDDTRKPVTINQQVMQPTGNPEAPFTAIKDNDITVGEYAVVVEAGPGYATKRQETSEKLMQLIQAVPVVGQVASDLIVKSLDIADATVIADRLKFTLPPQIQKSMQDAEQGGKPLDTAIQAAMGQAQQRIQQAETIIQQLHQELQKAQQENASGAAAEQGKALVEAQRAQAEAAKSRAEMARVEAENQTKKFNSLLDAASKIVSEAMKLPMADQEAAAKAATDAMEPVVGPEVEAMREMVAGLMAMAQQAQQSAMMAAAPRQIVIQRDESGRVIGGTSSVQ